MNSIVKGFAISISLAAMTGVAAQQVPAAYPSKGQSVDQQAADKSACTTWAHSNAATNSVPPPQTGPAVGGGQRVAGAARGAAAGAVIGSATGGNAGRGAGVGATAGVLAGGARARQAQAAQNQAAANTQAQNTVALGQAYGACMKGRGYTVN